MVFVNYILAPLVIVIILTLTLPISWVIVLLSKEVSRPVVLTGLPAEGGRGGDWKAGNLRDRVRAPS